MPKTDYLKIRIGNREVEIEQSNSFPVAIDYALEDADNFEQKKGSSAFDITIPATSNNSQTFNSPHNLQVEDLTADEFFTSPQPCLIEANGVELLTGKAFLKQATHTDRPQSITVNCYGNNADWVIDMKEMTLFDCVNPAVHAFTATNIQNSWAYGGTIEAQDFVYAPVRYRRAFLAQNGTADMIVTPFELKPAISIYWLLYRAFKSLGYKIAPGFFDTLYFRRMVLPWTWGSFLFTDDTLFAPYKFRAMCTHREHNTGMAGSWNEYVSPNSPVTVLENFTVTDVSSGGAMGGFEGTPGLYNFALGHDMNYHYPISSPLGPVAMGFTVSMYYKVYSGGGSNTWGLRAYWYINSTNVAVDLLHQYSGSGTEEGTASASRELTIQPGNFVTCVLRIDAQAALFSLNWEVGQPYPAPSSPVYPSSYFQNDYIKKALGSPVNFKQYPAFKNYKLLDLLRGLIDSFNLSLNTDPVAKVVTFEPTYPYALGSNPSAQQPGYFKPERVEWTDKQDLSKESVVELYSDNEREFDFKFKDDGNDGGLKILNKRYSVSAADSRYLFPERFKTGTKDYTNRFFSPVVHVRMPQWGGITNLVPQLIALIPENIANTSQAEDENIFQPKLAFYGGDFSGTGGWVWQPDPTNPATIVNRTTLPFMFAVNYHPGGESQPILSYNDQLIGDGSSAVVGSGLMRRYFLPRLAVMRHGKRYTTWMKLDLKDITNWQHREAIIIGNSTYYLVAVDKYKPLTDDTTQVTLWKYWPVTQKDSDSCFPSFASVSGSSTPLAPSDLKYARLFILTTDLPT